MKRFLTRVCACLLLAALLLPVADGLLPKGSVGVGGQPEPGIVTYGDDKPPKPIRP